MNEYRIFVGENNLFGIEDKNGAVLYEAEFSYIQATAIVAYFHEFGYATFEALCRAIPELLS